MKNRKPQLLLALDWARANCPTECISICSDSQSLLKAIQSGAHVVLTTDPETVLPVARATF